MSKVIVITETTADRYDLSQLQEFGPIDYLYSKDERVPSVFNLTELTKDFQSRLEDRYDKQRDFIALVGKQLHLSALCWVLGSNYREGDTRVVIFDSATNRYVEKEIGYEKR